MARKSHVKRKRNTTSQYRRTKAGRAFKKALGIADRECKKDYRGKACDKAKNKLFSALKRVQKITGLM